MELFIGIIFILMAIKMIYNLRKEKDHLANIVRISSIILILMMLEYYLDLERHMVFIFIICIFIYWIIKISKIMTTMFNMMDEYDEFKIKQTIFKDYKFIIFDLLLTIFLIFIFAHWVGLLHILDIS